VESVEPLVTNGPEFEDEEEGVPRPSKPTVH
jgi:hypothetical protein